LAAVAHRRPHLLLGLLISFPQKGLLGDSGHASGREGAGGISGFHFAELQANVVVWVMNWFMYKEGASARGARLFPHKIVRWYPLIPKTITVLGSLFCAEAAVNLRTSGAPRPLSEVEERFGEDVGAARMGQ
jgi:hypothetical protein